ncbi:MAG TPA: exodeoxyribonuclease III [Elusimicrobia bacterium]|nr:exodeoxyribonuclease III [Elusimicrobiota bacterium]HBT62378.1 exodeoxyribonuclease III [Elusimicrobiota bacterium]
MPGKSLLLLSWNVNGVRAAYKKGLLNWLQQTSPDILAIQETKARPEQLPEDLADPAGYQAEWHWAERKGYSGVATFHKRAPLEMRRGFGMPEFDGEGRVLASVYPDFILFNIYFPNGQKDASRLKFKLDFYEAFLRVLDRCRQDGEDRIIVCGDVNTAHQEIDLARPRENSGVSGFLPAERAWIDKLLADGFVDTFRQFEKGSGHYTWWDPLTRARQRNVGWRLDYFLISENLRPRLKRAFILPEVLGSDHCPVGMELEVS